MMQRPVIQITVFVSQKGNAMVLFFSDDEKRCVTTVMGQPLMFTRRPTVHCWLKLSCTTGLGTMQKIFTQISYYCWSDKLYKFNCGQATHANLQFLIVKNCISWTKVYMMTHILVKKCGKNHKIAPCVSSPIKQKL